MKTIALAMAALACVSTASAEQKFSAADVPGVHLRGRVVVSNDRHSITAYRSMGNIREALVTLRSSPTLSYTPYGGSVFQSDATLNAPMPQYLSRVVTEAARMHGVDPRLIAAVAARESAGNSRAVSRVGACGIMQLMPATARFLGITDIFDVRQNVFAGAHYLRTLLDTFHGDLDLTLAAYNAGPGAVQKYNGVPPYAETRAYVAHVRRAYEASLR